MTRTQLMRLGLVAGSITCLMMGAGCKKETPQQRTAAVENQLRQPAPPAAPTQQPTVPPEAANIPRPY